MTLHEAATLLDAAGIKFEAVNTPSGHGCCMLRLDEVEAYATDEPAFWCQKLGMTRETYDALERTEGHTWCAAYTKSGEPCKRYVGGMRSGVRFCKQHTPK